MKKPPVACVESGVERGAVSGAPAVARREQTGLAGARGLWCAPLIDSRLASGPQGLIQLTLNVMKSLSSWTVAVLLALAWPAFGAPKVGDTAPDFSLQGTDGRAYKLSEFKGKKGVVIAWFPKAFTGGCTAECKSLRENGAAIPKNGVALFAASVDDAATNKKFAESLGLDYPILSDPTKETAKAYGVLNEKGMASRWTFYIGKDGKILHIDQAVQPSDHGKTVSEQLQKLGIK